MYIDLYFGLLSSRWHISLLLIVTQCISAAILITPCSTVRNYVKSNVCVSRVMISAKCNYGPYLVGLISILLWYVLIILLVFYHCIVLNLFHAVDIVHVHIPSNVEDF